MHYDPLISSRAKSLVSWGHDWVVLCLIIVRPFWAPTKVFALPIAFRLYRNRQGLTKGKKKKGGKATKPCACRVRRRRYRRPLPSELPVTVSRQAAQAFTNVPGGTRLLWPVVLERGSADDSWHATTPSCPPCPDRLRCAKSDGESDSLPL